MPFIMTTKRLCPACVHGPAGGGEHRPESVSRRAVATLGKAHDLLGEILRELNVGVSSGDAAGDLHWTNLMVVGESGGKIGPLPDGTVIEVEPVDPMDLIGPGPWSASTLPDEAEAIAAYNAKEGS